MEKMGHEYAGKEIIGVRYYQSLRLSLSIIVIHWTFWRAIDWHCEILVASPLWKISYITATVVSQLVLQRLFIHHQTIKRALLSIAVGITKTVLTHIISLLSSGYVYIPLPLWHLIIKAITRVSCHRKWMCSALAHSAAGDKPCRRKSVDCRDCRDSIVMAHSTRWSVS